HEWAREAARFALVLGLHLQAEGTPVQTKDEGRGRGARSSHGKASGSRDWVVRRVYLDRITRSPEAGSAPASRDAAEGLTEDRIAAVVPVRGHLRRQRYGPKGSLRKWVYVGGYEARRWIAPRPLRVEVRTTERK